VVQLVLSLWKVDLSNQTAIARRFGIGIGDAQRVGLARVGAGEQGDVRESFRRCLGCERGRRIESWIGE
jgi:hypothetical protein